MREESYIVRIYRRGQRDLLVGIVETADAQWQQSFHSAQELASLLATSAYSKNGEAKTHRSGFERGFGLKWSGVSTVADSASGGNPAERHRIRLD